MWRLLVLVCVLMSSNAFAGTARGTLHVGITITGNGTRAAASANGIAAVGKPTASSGSTTASGIVNAR